MKIPGKTGFIQTMVDYGKVVYALVAVLCVFGIYSIFKINKDEFPTFVINQGLVAAVYPGADASQVESQLAKPLCDLLNAVPEVDRKSLHCVSRDGMCYIYVTINANQRKLQSVWSNIKHKINQNKIKLPAGVLTVQVLDEFADMSAVLLTLESDDKGWEEMRLYAEDLRDRLRKIDRLASASIIGEQQEEIAVTIDMERLGRYGISPSTLMLDYALSSLHVPSGTFDSDYTSAPITVSSSVTSEEEVENKIVWSDPAGHVVRLKDIATIERRIKEPSSLVQFNGNVSLVMNLVMRPDNNIVAFGRDVDEVLDAFQAQLPDSVHVHRITDQPKVVNHSVMGFLRDLFISIMVVIMVMIVMFPMRSALIASSGVPVCVLATIAVMYMSGMALNNVSLGALIIVLGMIVDDSIITMDGYMDNMVRGMSRLEAASAAARDLFMPMFMATLSICMMFFPVPHLIRGLLGEFCQYFPWVVLISLSASLIYAVTVVPSLEVRFIADRNAGRDNVITHLQNRMFSALQNGYDKALSFVFRHPWMTVASGIAAVALGVVMFMHLNIQMMPYAPRQSFVLEVYLEDGCNIRDTREIVDSLENILLKEDKIVSVTSFIAQGSPRFHGPYQPKFPDPCFAQLIVNTESLLATEELLPYMEAELEHRFPKALVAVRQLSYQACDVPVSLRITGEDRAALLSVADSIQNYMSREMTSELKWIHRDGGRFVSNVNVEVDPVAAARLGIDRAIVSASLSQGFGGMPLMNIYENGHHIPVNLYDGNVGGDMGYEAVADHLVPSMQAGVSVPVRQFATLESVWEPKELILHAGENAVIVGADLRYGNSQPKAMKKLDAYISTLDLPEGVHVTYGGLSEINSTVGKDIFVALFTAVAIMLFFLLLHFRKLSLAVLTMVLCSLCLFGASFSLWLFNQDFGITSVLGIVTLIGITVRNGIIMFEYADHLQHNEGVSVREAAYLAGSRRMRPIFLTSCTTALGVLPMVLSADTLWQPVGLTICFGIVFSIALMVFIMPVSYWMVFRRKGE